MVAIAMFAVMAAIFLGGYGAYFTLTTRGRSSWALTRELARRNRHIEAERRIADRSKISDVGVKTPAGLACPKCGGTQFKAGRKASTKVAFGVASLLGEAQHVRCVTCGTRYMRG